MLDPRFAEDRYRQQDISRGERENSRLINGTPEENGFTWVKLGANLGRWMTRKEYDDYRSEKDRE